MPLDQKDRVRISRLLAMFSSDADGEVINAARLAHKIIKGSGETWESFILGIPVSRTPNGHASAQSAWDDVVRRAKAKADEATAREHQQRREQQSHPWGKTAGSRPYMADVDACLEHPHLWNDWETEFLESLRSKKWPTLTDKQRVVLFGMTMKLAQHHADMGW
jgi:hypothetical protein